MDSYKEVEAVLVSNKKKDFFQILFVAILLSTLKTKLVTLTENITQNMLMTLKNLKGKINSKMQKIYC